MSSPVHGEFYSGSPSGRRCRSNTLSELETSDESALCKRCHKWRRPKRLSKTSDPLWYMGFCDVCASSCQKDCLFCGRAVSTDQTHWGTGLCDECYSKLPQCKGCARQLKAKEYKFKTGLCDTCYNSCEKTCRMCQKVISLGQLGWRTGLCNDCYDKSEKKCKKCSTVISLEEPGWRIQLCAQCLGKRGHACQAEISKKRSQTGLCDACYGKCDKTCTLCSDRIPSRELHWSSGLCDVCWEDCKKVCTQCNKRIPMKQIRWGSGLCDQCYSSSSKACRMCQSDISISQTYHGVRLCDKCFGCLTGNDKQCVSCSSTLTIGEQYWAVGLCNMCYAGHQLEGGPIIRRCATMDRLYEDDEIDNGKGIRFIYSAKTAALQRAYQEPTPMKDIAPWTMFLFLVFGISGWFGNNTIFAALPLLVDLPQGEAIGSLIQGSTQIGTIFAMAYYMIGSGDQAQAPAIEHGSNERARKFRRERREKRAAAQAAKASHAGQALVCVGLLSIAALWVWQPSTTALIFVSALTGAVGNTADLTVWPIALLHPSICAKAISVGGSLSGLLANFLEAGLEPLGVGGFFFFSGCLQVLCWGAVFAIAGCPDVRIGRGVRTGACTCAGCDACTLEKGPSPSRSSTTVLPLTQPLLEGTETRIPPATHSLAGRLKAWLEDATAWFTSLRFTMSSLIADPGGYCSMVFVFKTTNLISKALCYSVPSLLPFTVAGYSVGAERKQLLQYALTMYNAGNVIGRLYCPHGMALLVNAFVMFATFAIILLGAIFSRTVGNVVPYSVAWLVIPSIVGIFNFTTGALNTSLFVKAHSESQSGRCPETLPATMGFYGQVGCVGGNILMFFAINVFHLL